jgi:hypothetical protein
MAEPRSLLCSLLALLGLVLGCGSDARDEFEHARERVADGSAGFGVHSPHHASLAR